MPRPAKPVPQYERGLTGGRPPPLPADATPEEVYTLGLRWFKWAIPCATDPSWRLELMDRALQWVTSTPVELAEKNEDLKVALAEVTGISEARS